MAVIDHRAIVLAGVTAIVTGAVFLLPPIAQDPAYHQFADQRSLLGMAHFWNVLSNLPFLLVAAFGFAHLSAMENPVPRQAYAVLCAGIFLTAFGSTYYHLSPSNFSLAWDRLPMTIAFMALLSLLISERLSLRLGWLCLWPLLVAGAASVGYWQWTEAQGAGDLRPYGLVQFMPILLIPLMLWLYPRKFISAGFMWLAFSAYALAKLAEHFDAQIYQALGFISGHSIKHVLAAIAAWLILRAVTSKPIEDD